MPSCKLFLVGAILCLQSQQARSSCEEGYLQKGGDVPGFGSVNGFGNGQYVSSCASCAHHCSLDSECLSYECHPNELKCNLNSVRWPTSDQKVSAWEFCAKVKPMAKCPWGYEQKIGDVPGWAPYIVQDCDQCARLCDDRGESCNSFECSSTELRCNLNQETEPTQNLYNWRDYSFCSKLSWETADALVLVPKGSQNSQNSAGRYVRSGEMWKNRPLFVNRPNNRVIVPVYSSAHWVISSNSDFESRKSAYACYQIPYLWPHESFASTPLEGWPQYNVRQERDECAHGTHDCGPDSTCTDLVKGWQCTCNEGFEQHCGSDLYWRSSSGAFCGDYIGYRLCTADGGYGPGWGASDGVFADWADADGVDATEACCACGGGYREYGRCVPVQ